MEQTRVSVCALDAITQAGTTQCLSNSAGISVVPPSARANAAVVVAVMERFTTTAAQLLRRWAAEIPLPVVLLVDDIKESELPAAVECLVVVILPRDAVTDARLTEGVRIAASGGASIPPDLLGRLIRQTERLHNEVLQPSGLLESALTEREVDVLRLMADGLDTGEIAGNLYYSERTVKTIIYALTARLRLRNRTHAVAHAMRAGVI